MSGIGGTGGEVKGADSRLRTYERNAAGTAPLAGPPGFLRSFGGFWQARPGPRGTRLPTLDFSSQFYKNN